MTYALILLAIGLVLIGFALTPRKPYDAWVYVQGVPGTVVPAGIGFSNPQMEQYVSLLDTVIGVEGHAKLYVKRITP